MFGPHRAAVHSLWTSLFICAAFFLPQTCHIDFDGREGVFYRCNATNELNQRVGDIEEKVLMYEVQLCLSFCSDWRRGRNGQKNSVLVLQ